MSVRRSKIRTATLLHFLLGVSAVCLQALPMRIAAQERLAHGERGSVMVGAFVTSPDTSARLDSDTGIGTDIDLEDDLGLETSKTVARLDGYYWWSERHRIDLSYFEFARDSNKQIGRTIRFGDSTFVLGTEINANSDVKVFKAAYTFAAVVRERGNFGISAGVYTALVDLGLFETATGAGSEEDLTAPLPVFGVRGEYAVAERITLRGAVELFTLDSGDAGGRLSDSYVGADYSFNDHVAAGLAYNRVSMGIDAEERDGFEGELDWGYDGVLLYFKANFGR